MWTSHLWTRLSCFLEVDNSLLSSVLLLTWTALLKDTVMLSGYTGEKNHISDSLQMWPWWPIYRNTRIPWSQPVRLWCSSSMCSVSWTLLKTQPEKQGAWSDLLLQLYTPLRQKTVPVRFIFLSLIMLGAVWDFVRQRVELKYNTKQLQPAVSMLSKLTGFCLHSTDCLNARPVLLPGPIIPSPFISLIKASSTAVKDVPLQLSADQALSLEDR